MPKFGIRYYLIASLLMHVAIFLPLMSMATSRKTDMKVVEVFIVEPASVPQNDLQQSLHKVGKVAKSKPAKNEPAREAIKPQAIPQKRNEQTTQLPHNMHQDNTEQVVTHTVEPVQIVTQPVSVGHKSDAVQGVLAVSAASAEGVGNRSIPALGTMTEATGEMMMGDVGAPRFIHREAPVYPFIARKLGREGRVVLRLSLDEKGGLQNVEVAVNGGYGFTEAAISAVKKSVFAPAHKDGKAVSSKVALPVRFVLRGEGS